METGEKTVRAVAIDDSALEGISSGQAICCGCSVAPGLIHKESVHGPNGDDGE
jgi:hypothetical protein